LVHAVLFDLDRTLLDFDRAQRAALRASLRGHGLPSSPRVLLLYRTINESLWAAYRRGEIAQKTLAVERFRLLLRALGARESKAPALARAFTSRLARRGDRLPGCRATLRTLARSFRLGVVTNGIHRVQHARLGAAGLRPFFETVVTSEGCGFAKPDPRILHEALDAMAVAPRHAVYVGDDPSVDGRAAAAAGMAFVWVDRGYGLPETEPRPRHRVTHLRELAPSLEGLAAGRGEGSL
jgi:2-haloacid dehalogenase